MERVKYIDTEFGPFELIKNHREGFDLQDFNSKYIGELFDQYDYLVGDISSGILRLKGFKGDDNLINGYKTIPDYLNESCNYNISYYILKRIKENNIEEQPKKKEVKKRWRKRKN